MPKRRSRRSVRPTGNRTTWGLFAAVAGGALIVRIACLWDLRDSPTFFFPVIDADTYDALARGFARNGKLSEAFFWQPFFYPCFLSFLYSATHSSILSAKVFQIVLGAVTCGLTALFARQLFDRRTAALAGTILAFCGSAIFLATELVATAFEVFWAVALVWFFARLGANTPILAYLGLGACGALSVLTRPTFLPFFIAACVWQGIVLFKATSVRAILAAFLALVGFLSVVQPVAFLNYRTTGRWSFLPDSGAINLYIGNNPDSDRTVGIRPGWAWDRLTLEPRSEGMSPSQASSYFAGKVRDYVAGDPLGFARGIARKAVQFLSSREIPRNVDVYAYRQWSPLLGVLVWKWGAFGFPFGVILPLAAVGLAVRRRAFPVPVWLFLAFYPSAVIAVFVSSRYRAPVLPILAVAAAAGTLYLFDLARQRRFGRLAAWVGGCAGLAVVVSLPGPFTQEKTDYTAEMYYCLASRFFKERHDAEAARFFHLALDRRPDYPEVLDKLGLLAQRNGDLAAAEAFFRKALDANPRHEGICLDLGDLLESRGHLSEAEALFRKAVDLDPSLAEGHNKLGILLGRSGRHKEALRHFRESVRLEPKNAGYATNLGATLFEMGQTEEAIAQYRRALKLDPSLEAARLNLDEALRSAKGRGVESRRE